MEPNPWGRSNCHLSLQQSRVHLGEHDWRHPGPDHQVMDGTPGLAEARRFSTASHSEVHRVDHPVPDGRRGQPCIPLTREARPRGELGGVTAATSEATVTIPDPQVRARRSRSRLGWSGWALAAASVYEVPAPVEVAVAAGIEGCTLGGRVDGICQVARVSRARRRFYRSSWRRDHAWMESAPKTSGTLGTVRSAAVGTASGSIAHNAGATIGTHAPIPITAMN